MEMFWLGAPMAYPEVVQPGRVEFQTQPLICMPPSGFAVNGVSFVGSFFRYGPRQVAAFIACMGQPAPIAPGIHPDAGAVALVRSDGRG